MLKNIYHLFTTRRIRIVSRLLFEREIYMYISDALYSISMLPFRKSFLDLMHFCLIKAFDPCIYTAYI